MEALARPTWAEALVGEAEGLGGIVDVGFSSVVVQDILAMFANRQLLEHIVHVTVGSFILMRFWCHHHHRHHHRRFICFQVSFDAQCVVVVYLHERVRHIQVLCVNCVCQSACT